jgi:sec-independent protein translocase protein TatA
MPRIGPVELILVMVIVTMLFGVGKLPEVFGAVGKGIREFRRNSEDASEPSVAPVTTVSTVTTPTDEEIVATTTPTNPGAQATPVH